MILLAEEKQNTAMQIIRNERIIMHAKRPCPSKKNVSVTSRMSLKHRVELMGIIWLLHVTAAEGTLVIFFKVFVCRLFACETYGDPFCASLGCFSFDDSTPRPTTHIPTYSPKPTTRSTPRPTNVNWPTFSDTPKPTTSNVNLPTVSGPCCGVEGNFAAIGNEDVLYDAVDFFITNQADAEATYGPINCWDVSSITNMDLLFLGLFDDWLVFNEDLSCWDVSSVTSAFAMFEYVTINQALCWNLASVTDPANVECMLYNTAGATLQAGCGTSTEIIEASQTCLDDYL